MRDTLNEILYVLNYRPRSYYAVLAGMVFGLMVNVLIWYIASTGDGPFKPFFDALGQASPWAGLIIFGYCAVAAIPMYLRDRDEVFSRF